MTSIAFVTTCKKRLHHICQTLPLIVRAQASEIIFVDYGCPDNSGSWVEANYPGVKVVRVTDDPGFCLARARNIGVAAASAEWLVMIDGDILIEPEWLDWMQRNISVGSFYRSEPIDGRRDPETYGTIICRRADFNAVGGYDEVFRGWGGEDDDLYFRLVGRGLVQSHYPARFVSAIHHGHDERAGWEGMRDMEDKALLNHCYMTAKIQAVTANGGSPLPLESRHSLMVGTKHALTKWFKEGADKPLPIHYVLARTSPMTLGGRNHIESELTITVRVRREQSPSR